MALATFLTPSCRDDGQWVLLDRTGKAVSDTFPSKATAAQWALESGYEVFETDGDPMPIRFSPKDTRC